MAKELPNSHSYLLSDLLTNFRLREQLFQELDIYFEYGPEERNVVLYTASRNSWLVASKMVEWRQGTWVWKDIYTQGTCEFLPPKFTIIDDVPLVDKHGHRVCILRSKIVEVIREWWNQPRFRELQLGGSHATTR